MDLLLVAGLLAIMAVTAVALAVIRRKTDDDIDWEP